MTGVHWARDRKELVSTHGFPGNAVAGWAYPPPSGSSGSRTGSGGAGTGAVPNAKIFEIRDAHDARVLFSALSPNGEVLVTGAGDENLKFWRIWEAKEVKKKSKAKEEMSTGRGILSIR